MDASWRVRFILLVVLVVIITGDWITFPEFKLDESNDASSARNRNARRNPTTFLDEKPELEIDGEVENDGKMRVSSYAVRADCLPKLVCELAGQPPDDLGQKERSLLNLIRTSGLGTVAEVSSRWHFAAHMGQLLGGNRGAGCASLWPGCPIPLNILLGLARRISLKQS